MFDDYYLCMQKRRKRIRLHILHVYNWTQFDISMYNDITYINYFIIKLKECEECILN
jgi:hypothetical protein